MSAADALDICLGLFHLWLVAALAVLLFLAALDTYHTLFHPLKDEETDADPTA